MLDFTKLAEKFEVEEHQVQDVLDLLDYKRNSGGEEPTHAGVVDDDDSSDKFHGHTGYWMAWGRDAIGVTNGDIVYFSLDDEEACMEFQIVYDALEHHLIW